MFYFPAFGLFALAPGSYFSVQDEPSAYDANFLAGIRFGQRRKEDSCHRDYRCNSTFFPKVFGINSGRLKFAQENTPGGKGMSASGKESVQLDNCQHIKGWQSGTVALTFS